MIERVIFFTSCATGEATANETLIPIVTTIFGKNLSCNKAMVTEAFSPLERDPFIRNHEGSTDNCGATNGKD